MSELNRDLLKHLVDTILSNTEMSQEEADRAFSFSRVIAKYPDLARAWGVVLSAHDPRAVAVWDATTRSIDLALEALRVVRDSANPQAPAELRDLAASVLSRVGGWTS